MGFIVFMLYMWILRYEELIGCLTVKLGVKFGFGRGIVCGGGVDSLKVVFARFSRMLVLI